MELSEIDQPTRLETVEQQHNRSPFTDQSQMTGDQRARLPLPAIAVLGNEIAHARQKLQKCSSVLRLICHRYSKVHTIVAAPLGPASVHQNVAKAATSPATKTVITLRVCHRFLQESEGSLQGAWRLMISGH